MKLRFSRRRTDRWYFLAFTLAIVTTEWVLLRKARKALPA
jgi:hypothetical protein